MMTKPGGLRRIQLVRRDLSHLLFHFTRRSSSVEGGDERFAASARDVLWKILREGCLCGSSKLVRGGFRTISFTEAPISEVASIFRVWMTRQECPRYEPYGIAVRKEWLFRRGGRPVIYQPESEFEQLPSGLQHRHVRYDPEAGIDFTWEREWRVRQDVLHLEIEKTLVVVPTAAEAFDLMYDHGNWEVDVDEGVPLGAGLSAKWLAISLDFFGLPPEEDAPTEITPRGGSL